MADLDTGEGGGHGKKRGGVRAKKMSTKIDMTPLVDLAFLLVTFFMMTTTFNKPNAMEVVMPEKPKPEDAPSNLGVVGRYILQPEVMRVLDRHEKGAGGEIQLTDAMAQLIGTQPFHGVTVDAIRYDCGDKTGFVTANLALALDRPDVGPAVRAFVMNLR